MPAHKLQDRLKLYGFEISIENAKGSVRRWYDPNGKEKGSTKMHWDYGYIRNTKGTDGDHVDVYVGPNPESERVFIVDQMKKPPGEIKKDGQAWKQFDEQKVMLAFKDAAAAKTAYLRQYDDPRFFGSMKEMSVEDFRSKVLAPENHGKKVANGDMMAYFQEHPEKYEAYKKRQEQKKKASLLLAELNLAKRASGEPIVRLLGESSPGVSAVPPVTAYAQTTTSPAERREADREMKSAGLSHTHETSRGLSPAAVRQGRKVEMEHTKDTGTARQIAIDHLHEDPRYYDKLRKVEGKTAERAHVIADRVDDVGIGLLASPYVADVAGHGLARARNPKLKALGTAVEKGFGTSSRYGKSHGREIAGLAMVAPGVTHGVARGIDKVLPQKKTAELEKVAARLYEDWEYKTESEKAAVLGFLGRMAGSTTRLVGGAGKAVTGAGAGLQGAVGRASDQLRGGFIAGNRQVSQAVGERAARIGRTTAPKAVTPVPSQTVKPTLAAVPAASAGASKWNPLTPRNMLLAGGGLALGAGAYGGYKGIQAASNLLQTHHDAPLASPGFAGTGRVF